MGVSVELARFEGTNLARYAQYLGETLGHPPVRLTEEDDHGGDEESSNDRGVDKNAQTQSG